MRTGERFGAGYIINFIRGSASEKIDPAHKELKTYGIGKDLKKEEWQWIVQQLVYHRLLHKTEDQYQVLKLNEKSWKLLKGESVLKLVLKKEKVEAESDEEIAYDPALMKNLKGVREDIAGQEHVPAYIIVSDSTLADLATYLPHTYDELKQISGFGDYKVGKYGAHFLKVIKQYADEHNLQSRMQLKKPKSERRERTAKPAANSTMHVSLTMFKEGLGVGEIAVRRGLAPSTIESHLAAYVAAGELGIDRLVPKEKLDKIIETIKITGQSIAAKPVRDILGDDFSYGEIRMAMEYYKSGHA